MSPSGSCALSERSGSDFVAVALAIAPLAISGVAPLLGRAPLGVPILLAAAAVTRVLYAAIFSRGELDRLVAGGVRLAPIVLWTVAATLSQVAYFVPLSDELGRASSTYLASSVAVAILWLLAGVVVGSATLPRSGHSSLAIIAVAFGSVLFALDGGLVVNFGRLSAESGFEINHLTVADFLLVCLFFAYAMGGRLMRAAVLFCLPVVLFAAGGRSALIIGFASVCVVSLRQRRMTEVFLALAAVVVVVLSVAQTVDVSDPLVSRMLLSDGLGEDGSVIERQEQFMRGLSELPSQALVGDVRAIALGAGSLGGYIHNGLSAWQFFGLPGFILLAVALMRALQHSWPSHAALDPSATLKALLAVNAIGGFLFAKSALHFSLWFALGVSLTPSRSSGGTAE